MTETPRRAPATFSIGVHYQRSILLAPDEARRRVSLAYALLLGVAPWPCEPAPAREQMETAPAHYYRSPTLSIPLFHTTTLPAAMAALCARRSGRP